MYIRALKFTVNVLVNKDVHMYIHTKTEAFGCCLSSSLSASVRMCVLMYVLVQLEIH